MVSPDHAVRSVLSFLGDLCVSLYSLRILRFLCVHCVNLPPQIFNEKDTDKQRSRRRLSVL